MSNFILLVTKKHEEKTNKNEYPCEHVENMLKYYPVRKYGLDVMLLRPALGLIPS